MKNSEKTMLAIVGLFVSTAVLAQPAPPATPIDGGLSMLLAAGGLYGVKKVYDKVKK